MEKNPERERDIYSLWTKGYKIVQISEQTGIPISSVGYYTKKFKEREKRRGYTGPSLEEVLRRAVPNAPPGTIVYDFTEPRTRKPNTETEETKTARRKELINKELLRFSIEDYQEKLKNTFITLMQQGNCTQANDFCASLLSYINLSQRFTDIKEGRKKIRPDDFEVLAAIFYPELYKKVYKPFSK